jgi:LuxR family maltose regulon positive regulatory protein
MGISDLLPHDQPPADLRALLATKLGAPLLRGRLVPRVQLFARLDQGLRHPLLLVVGPAGSGKSTLVASWLASRANAERQPQAGERPGSEKVDSVPRSCWLSLDAGDNDPQRFFSYLLAALRQVAPGLGTATASLLGGPHLPTCETLIVPLLNDLAATPAPLILILDDYHLIENALIHEGIALLVERGPPHFHLLLATRADPPLPLPRLRARDRLTEVRAAALRFAPEEITAFYQQTMPLPLDDASLQLLASHTEGWAVGLQLAGLSLRDRSPTECAAFVQRFGASSQYVIDYLVDEVLSQQPPYRRSFLLHTAILDRLCGSLCDAVLGLAENTPGSEPAATECAGTSCPPPHQQRECGAYSQRLLEELECANLFLIPLDPERRWYRYHPLFAETLRAQLAAEPELQARLHRRAADWFAAHSLWDEGVRHALAAGDLPLAARFIQQAGDALLERGEILTLHGWLDTLPEAFVAQQPALAILHAAVAYISGSLKQSERLCQQVAALPVHQLDDRSRGRLLALQAFQSNAGEGPETVALATRALELLDDDAIFRQIALMALGHGQRRAGATSAASTTYCTAVELGRTRQLPYLTMNLLNSLAVNLNEQGQRRAALQLCAAARDEWSDTRGHPLPILDLLAVAEAVLAYEGNQLEIARDHAEHGWEAIRRWISERIVGVDTERVAILASAGLGDVTAAHQAVRQARAVASSLHWFGPSVDALEAELWLRQGDLAAAERWAREAGLSPDDTPNAMREPSYFTYARLLLAQGRLADVERLLRRLETAVRAGPRLARLITVRLLQALLATQQGDGAVAAAALAEALDLAAPGDYIRRFLDEGPHVLALLEAPGATRSAQGDSPHAAFIVRLRDAFADAGHASGQHGDPRPSLHAARALTDALLEPLSEQELTVLQLIAAGCSNQAIAEQLVITVGTAKWHVHNLYGKLGISGRLAAVACARELGLLERRTDKTGRGAVDAASTR